MANKKIQEKIEAAVTDMLVAGTTLSKTFITPAAKDIAKIELCNKIEGLVDSLTKKPKKEGKK